MIKKKLIRNIVKGEDLDAKKFSPQLIIYHIDQWKNKGLLPKDVKLKIWINYKINIKSLRNLSK